MPARLLRRLIARVRAVVHRLSDQLMAATRPTIAPVASNALVDLARSKPTLLAGNAPLRHQLTIVRRGVKRPRCTPGDRALLVLLAGRVRA